MATIRQVLITLEEVQEKRSKEVNELRSQKLLAGIVFKGNSFESDETSRNHLSAVVARLAMPNATLPNNFAWRTADNKDVPMNKEDVLSFQGAITDWVYNLYNASWKHKSAIAALTSIEDAESYDIQKDWPEDTL
ncbi:MAG: DUF4376 domain-containing protein [Deltaproteobacteria bacterium]|nr:DUF4376 domain-containing protein [Deltaproteobacteria bacterium]